MSELTYNLALLAGIGLAGGGVAMVSVPAALVVVGALIIALTIFTANLVRKG